VGGCCDDRDGDERAHERVTTRGHAAISGRVGFA
jgi:hypothetical protein